MDDPKRYTVIFEGDIRKMRLNLFEFVSPFGTVVGLMADDALERIEELETELSLLRKGDHHG